MVEDKEFQMRLAASIYECIENIYFENCDTEEIKQLMPEA